ARVPLSARGGGQFADVRQLDLSGPPLPRPLDAEAGSVLPLSQPRRVDAEGAGAPLEARAHERLHQGRQARGDGRHPRVDRGAEVLPQVDDDYLRVAAISRLIAASAALCAAASAS